jgi:hypothetical protein
MRIGVRKGMMFWGRERLAESYYESAVAEMNKPNPDRGKALWHLDRATNLNPTFAEAITMKEELSGVSVTSAENSTIRGFVRRQIIAERRAHAATMPSSVLDLSGIDNSSSEGVVATTQPSDGAATQPSLADLEAMIPATQPLEGSESASIDDQMGGGLPNANSSSDDDLSVTPVTDPTSQPTTQPTTQPATAPSSSSGQPSNVTELPTEPVNVNSGGTWSGDGNK